MEKVSWPAWYYGPNNAGAVFDKEADVPAGWVDHPSKVSGAKAPTPPMATPPGLPKVAAPTDSGKPVTPVAPKKKAGRPPKAKAPLDL